MGATGGGVAFGVIGGGAPSSGGGSGGVFCCGRTGGVSCCCKGGVFCCAKRSAPAKSSSAQTKRRFITKVREDETECLKCKLRMVEDRQRIVAQGSSLWGDRARCRSR